MSTITIARIARKEPNYIWIEATDGMTYAGVNDSEPGKRVRRMQYGTWKTGSRDIDQPIDYVRMPRAIRRAMVAHFGHAHYAKAERPLDAGERNDVERAEWNKRNPDSPSAMAAHNWR
jgi:hypothetical protein